MANTILNDDTKITVQALVINICYTYIYLIMAKKCIAKIAESIVPQRF